MSESFKVGEIAILEYERAPPFGYAGQEVEIINIYKTRYAIRTSDGEEWNCLPSQLRKKRPPRDDLQVVRWAECPWQPEKARA